MAITRISLLSIIVLIFSVSCRKRALESDNGHLKAAISSGIDSIDPAISYDTVSGTVVYQVYEQLYQYNYLRRPFTIEPLLAEGMPIISGDKKTVTIKIKRMSITIMILRCHKVESLRLKTLLPKLNALHLFRQSLLAPGFMRIF